MNVYNIGLLWVDRQASSIEFLITNFQNAPYKVGVGHSVVLKYLQNFTVDLKFTAASHVSKPSVGCNHRTELDPALKSRIGPPENRSHVILSHCQGLPTYSMPNHHTHHPGNQTSRPFRFNLSSTSRQAATRRR